MNPVRWVLGIRLSTPTQRAAWEQHLAHAFAAAQRALAEKQRAEAEKREAQRILAILSEPLKDWDLADFPGLLSINHDVAQHLAAIQQAYELVKRDAAHARMTVTANDKLRERGWADQPIQPNTNDGPKRGRYYR